MLPYKENMLRSEHIDFFSYIVCVFSCFLSKNILLPAVQTATYRAFYADFFFQTAIYIASMTNYFDLVKIKSISSVRASPTTTRKFSPASVHRRGPVRRHGCGRAPSNVACIHFNNYWNETDGIRPNQTDFIQVQI